jgi:dimethylhistidine N-methyltransferase
MTHTTSLLPGSPTAKRTDLQLPEKGWHDALVRDVRVGLTAQPKSLPSRWLYEGAGSELFEEITRLEEYYPTRTEREILARHADRIARLTGARTVIELGSGTSEKTRLLLDAIDEDGGLCAFVAVDVAEPILSCAVDELAERYPTAAVSSLVADFNQDLAALPGTHSRLVVFLGGTIGNLDPTERHQLLTRLGELLDDGEHLLVGTDLVKDPARLLAAYDDPAGVTAAFEKNALAVINDGLGADFDLDDFAYVARWNPETNVIEMSLCSLVSQEITIAELGLSVHFDQGEELRTEISAKFELAGVRKELASTGFVTVDQWQDQAGDYGLTLVRRVRSGTGLNAPRRPRRMSLGLQNVPEPSVSGYRRVRAATEALAQSLSAEDQTVQSMPDVSPTKWHRGHVTWFFEQFVLLPHQPGYRPVDERYQYLFNSYYEGAGPRHPRAERGLLSRPGAGEVAGYRQAVDEGIETLLADPSPEVCSLVELGLHHEQQHQELLLMDIKHVLGANPLNPAYLRDAQSGDSRTADRRTARRSLRWISHPGGVVETGAPGLAARGLLDFSGGFSFDNETPRHRVWLEPFAIADRLVTAGEWLEFMADGGYKRANLWLSDGWAVNQVEARRAPLYWSEGAEGWEIFTLNGRQPLDPDLPVVHLSYYEADAFARWAGARLPTEFEWEAIAATAPPPETRPIALHPRRAVVEDGSVHVCQLYGEAWQWTSSAYLPYPRFDPLVGIIGEYNAKFMVGQQVVRGSATITAPGHARATYRNFFSPAARWAFTGVRLARDV